MTEEELSKLDIFDDKQWLTLTETKRIEQLQKLEDYYADKQGRPKITLNYVPSGAPDLYWSRMQLIDTVIHEGKHADQYNVLQEVK